MGRIGFDNRKYLEEQSGEILKRISQFDGKLYLEFGGKFLFDYHAARVLPGYDPNIKIKLLKQLQDKIDILLCIYAGDIEKGRIRGDFGITYDVDALKLIDGLRANGLEITAVVITRFDNQPQAVRFQKVLEKRNIRVYRHVATKGYPTDVDTIVSEDGYGKNPYIETKNPLVVMTGPGPGSGKLATCLSQLYHDYRQGLKSHYAKFETFPIWNIPLKHPVNMAYEAATADIEDVNMIDPFHLSAYNVSSVNYNRDVEIFPVIKSILKKISGGELAYQSPTDMGVNRAGFAITDNAVVEEAAKQEMIRRYFRYSLEQAMGVEKKETVDRLKLLMDEAGVDIKDRKVIGPARDAVMKAKNGEVAPEISCGAAVELDSGVIVTGRNSLLMSAASAAIVNAIKTLADIPDKIHLLSKDIIGKVLQFKRDALKSKSGSLNLEEVLICLSISAITNPTVELALEKLKDLENCEMHLTHIPTPGDEEGLRSLRLNTTIEPNFSTRELFVK